MNRQSIAQSRKAQSEIVLNQYQIPINQYLPIIEDESDISPRSQTEIALRAMALLIVAVKAEGLEQETIDSLIANYQLETVFSPNELTFIKDESPSQHDKTQFIWRYEAAWVLLWALGYVDELSYPSSICDVPAAVTFMQQRTQEQFIADAKLRKLPIILDETDLIFRYHWAVVDARLNGRPTPSELNSSVVMERHYALNWLTIDSNQPWDEVSTNT